MAILPKILNSSNQTNPDQTEGILQKNDQIVPFKSVKIIEKEGRKGGRKGGRREGGRKEERPRISQIGETKKT